MSARRTLLVLMVGALWCGVGYAEQGGSLLLDERYSRPVAYGVQMSDQEPYAQAETSEGVARAAGARSPKKAFLFSALVPGSGELYAGSKRGFVMLGVEVALWTTWLVLDRRGEDFRDDYEQFAEAHWNETAYLYWEGAYLDTTQSTKTHSLPERHDQEYYEMIYKYDQFVLGWDDTGQYDPSQYTTIEQLGGVESENRFTYRGMRDDSNKYLKPCQYVQGAILFNHIVSAIQAARCARPVHASLTERPVRLQMALGSDGYGPAAKLVASKRF